MKSKGLLMILFLGTIAALCLWVLVILGSCALVMFSI